MGHCLRATVCLQCSGAHDIHMCPLPKPTASNQHQTPVYRCCNCARTPNQPSNHRADDPVCPHRALYLETRSKPTRRGRPTTTPQPQRMETRSPQHQATAPQRQAMVETPVDSSSYASAVRGARQTREHVRQENTASTGLFSMEQITNIMIEAITDFENCQSKLDQLRVIASLLQKCI